MPLQKPLCFKPCYKWITFNTNEKDELLQDTVSMGFKPCYKWITFNTKLHYFVIYFSFFFLVLNLVINGLPSIRRIRR